MEKETLKRIQEAATLFQQTIEGVLGPDAVCLVGWAATKPIDQILSNTAHGYIFSEKTTPKDLAFMLFILNGKMFVASESNPNNTEKV